MCEGRGIEEYGRLQSLLNGERSYKRLVELFHRADEKYNSGLFHFQSERGREPPDELTPDLNLDDKVLKDILRRLYYPESPYEFAAMPAEILGQVYEQFLGKVIRLTAGHRAKIEEKPEVRKAGGVYYTPTYIVDYIVENTVGKLLAGKTPQEVGGLTATFKPAKNARPLAILDPACGSGSFLIVAYQYMLDWYLKQYTENNDPEKHARGASPRVYQAPTGDWRLTIAKRKRILLAHIYGVDIDYQAVEVTKLSLLLKVLEKETEATIQRELFAKQRALPDLADNIKCGNSLIGPDFYTGQQRDLFTDEDRLRINAFDWRGKHGFPRIFSGENPGFDAVIGIPPWGGDIDSITSYLAARYPQSTQAYRDTAKVFVDQGLRLIRKDGILSFVVPSAFLFQPRYQDIRNLLRQSSLQRIWNVGDKVFGSNVVAPCCIFVVSKRPPINLHSVLVADTSFRKTNLERIAQVPNLPTASVLQNAYEKTPQNVFVGYYREMRIGEVPLSEVLDCKDCGIKHQRVGCGMEEKGKSDLVTRLYYEGPQQRKSDRRYLIGADLNQNGWYMSVSNERYFRADYHSILRDNEIVYFNESVFDLEAKIVWRQTSDRVRATIIGPYWFANTLQAGILRDRKYDLKYILGLLNSRFLNFLYIESVKEAGRVFPQVKMGKLKCLPFRTIDFLDRTEKRKHDQNSGISPADARSLRSASKAQNRPRAFRARASNRAHRSRNRRPRLRALRTLRQRNLPRRGRNGRSRIP